MGPSKEAVALARYLLTLDGAYLIERADESKVIDLAYELQEYGRKWVVDREEPKG